MRHPNIVNSVWIPDYSESRNNNNRLIRELSLSLSLERYDRLEYLEITVFLQIGGYLSRI